MNKLKLSIAGGLLFLVSLLIGNQVPVKLGSVSNTNEYLATSTITNYVVIQSPVGKGSLNPAGTRVATSAPTVLGSVIITTAGTSPFCIHDATSTVPNGEWATTTVACFKASTAEGTYTFDVQLKKGILLDFTGSATATSKPTTTITYR